MKPPKRRNRPPPSPEYLAEIAARNANVDFTAGEQDTAEMYLVRVKSIAASNDRVKMAKIAAEILGEMWKAKILLNNPFFYEIDSSPLGRTVRALKEVTSVGETVESVTDRITKRMRMGAQFKDRIIADVSARLSNNVAQQYTAVEKTLSCLLQENEGIISNELQDIINEKLTEVRTIIKDGGRSV